ncbi:MAG: hypothetical protein HOP30_16930 [Cyclobacteriaceae bacterium]|nr:hypothetical protein [Cyclobacteriaceae bacterium]
MKQGLIFIAKIFLVAIVCCKMLLCFSIDSLSKTSTISFFDQPTECEMDGEEKPDFEPEDEYFVHAVPIHAYGIIKTNHLFTRLSSQLIEGLIFEIVPPPPKA